MSIQALFVVAFLNNYNAETTEINAAFASFLYTIITTDAVEIEEYKYTDLLDKIAAIFNLSRNFVVDFKDPLTRIEDTEAKTAFNVFNSSTANNTLSTTLSLTNNQLRTLIFCAIMKNSYDGSYEMIEKTYNTVIRLIASEIDVAASWKIYQKTKYEMDQYGTSVIKYPAAVDCILSYVNYDFNSDNAIKSQYFTLFFAGLLTIQSVGIRYYRTASQLQNILRWGDESTYTSDIHCWDGTEGNERRFL